MARSSAKPQVRSTGVSFNNAKGNMNRRTEDLELERNNPTFQRRARKSHLSQLPRSAFEHPFVSWHHQSISESPTALYNDAPGYDKTRTHICIDRDSGFQPSICRGAKPGASTSPGIVASTAGPAVAAAASAAPARFPGKPTRTRPAAVRPAGLCYLDDRSGSKCGCSGHR